MSNNGTHNGNGQIDWSSSYITPEWVAKAGVYRVTHEEGAELLGRKNPNGKENLAGLAIPYVTPGKEDAKSFYCRLRLASPGFDTQPDGTLKERRKYLQPFSSFNSAYFPPETSAEWFNDPAIPAVLVEGEKKAIALRRYFYERGEDVLVIGIPGVWNFTNRETLRDTLGHTWAYVKAVLPEIERIAWEGRAVKILFDANAMTNSSVRAARRELGSKLTQRGANVRTVDLMPEPGINGLDDYLGKHGPVAFEKFLAANPGTPARMSHEDAKAVVATLTAEAIKANPSLTGEERSLCALSVIYTELPGDWLAVSETLRKAKQLAFVQKQIKARIDTPRKKPPKPKPEPGEEAEPRITIDINLVQDLPTLAVMGWNAVRLRNSGPHLFVRAGIPVRLEKDEGGRPVLAELTPDRMRYEAALAADWQDEGEDCFPPMEVVKNMLAAPEMPLPCLKRITSVPVFASDGRLIDQPGFDKASGIYYMPAAGFTAIPIPETVTSDDVNAANALICNELLVDFPFAYIEEEEGDKKIIHTPDRDNAVALCVIGAVREMIYGSTPNHAIEASIRSAGKGKLARACLGIFNYVKSTPPLDTEQEWRRMITSQLYSGKSCCLIDNIERPLRSAALALAWTEEEWEDIVFHKQEMRGVPIRTIWATTANNLVMHEDLMTRSIRIRLEPETSHPEARTGLKDLDKWCAENHARLVHAVLVLVRHWIQHGRPAPKELQSTRHAEWCRVVGGILQLAGYKDFLANQREFQRTASIGLDATAAFCSLWWGWAQHSGIDDSPERRQTRAFTSELLDLARNVDGFPLTDNKDGQSRAMGIWLNGVRGRRIECEEDFGERRVCCTYRISRHATQIRGKQPWKIELLGRVDIGKALGEG